jgi:hypothetical protein
MGVASSNWYLIVVFNGFFSVQVVTLVSIPWWKAKVKRFEYNIANIFI